MAIYCNGDSAMLPLPCFHCHFAIVILPLPYSHRQFSIAMLPDPIAMIPLHCWWEWHHDNGNGDFNDNNDHNGIDNDNHDCNVDGNIAIAMATWQRQHGTWQHGNMATFKHYNGAMAIKQWQPCDGNMAMAILQWQHGNGHMIIGTWQWQHDTWQHGNGNMAIATWKWHHGMGKMAITS